MRRPRCRERVEARQGRELLSDYAGLVQFRFKTAVRSVQFRLKTYSGLVWFRCRAAVRSVQFRSRTHALRYSGACGDGW
jgi:hypothetical protein